MEREQFDHSLNPSYNYQLHECCRDIPSPFRSDQELISLNTLQDIEVFDQDYIERLLETHSESEVIDFKILGDQIGQDSETCHQVLTLQAQDKEGLLEVGNFGLNQIQAELMEESSLADLLLTGAEAVEARNWTLATDIIQKLHTMLSDMDDESCSFNRLAFFFTHALHYKSMGASPYIVHEPVSVNVDNMITFQIIQELSPWLKFAHFTSNQAILEATEGNQEVHVIDFDIMDGSQWPPFMVDLAMRNKGSALRVTAVIMEQENEIFIQQTGRRLMEFAASIQFPFTFDQVKFSREQDPFESTTQAGHPLIVNCMMHQYMSNRSFSTLKTFLDTVRKLSPNLLVLVEDELFHVAKIHCMSFVEFFCEALHHYNAMSDSLAGSSWGGYKIEPPFIEKDYLGFRILDSVRQFPCEREEIMSLWEEGLSYLKGFKVVPMSSCNISQAKFLVNLFGGGYRVQYDKGRLALCWKSRPLIAASIWVPTT